MTNRKKIVFIVILCICIHFILIILFTKLSSLKNEHRIQLKNYKKLKECKILFMGDSHTARAVDYTKIDSSYSLAYFGENNMMNYYKLRYIIENKYAIPNYVILTCDIVIHTYGFNLARNNKTFYYSLIQLKDLKDLEDNVMLTYIDYCKYKFFPYLDWQYATNLVNLEREKKSKKIFSDLSIEKRKKKANTFVVNESLNNGKKESFYSERALNYIQKTINLCKENNIKLIFIKIPLTKYIFDEIKFNVDSNYITNRPSENIIRNNNLPILDFEYLFQNNDSLFFDSHHLNKKGKDKFTIILKQKMDSLMKVY